MVKLRTDLLVNSQKIERDSKAEQCSVLVFFVVGFFFFFSCQKVNSVVAIFNLNSLLMSV